MAEIHNTKRVRTERLTTFLKTPWGQRVAALGTSPRHVAGGVALGLGLSCVPLPFLGTIAAPLLAPLLRLSTLAALLGTALVNPVTTPLLYGAELYVGTRVLGRSLPHWESMSTFSGAQWSTFLAEAAWPLLVGALVMTPLTVLPIYLITLAMLTWRRRVERSPMEAKALR